MTKFFKALLVAMKNRTLDRIEFTEPGINAIDFAMKLHDFCNRFGFKYNNVAFSGDNVTVIGMCRPNVITLQAFCHMKKSA